MNNELVHLLPVYPGNNAYEYKHFSPAVFILQTCKVNQTPAFQAVYENWK